MKAVSIFEDGTVKDVYDTDFYADDGVELFALSDEDFQTVTEAVFLRAFKYVNGRLIDSGVTLESCSATAPASGEIPQSVL
jgi:hypothetical protein